jgi:hypothetical protein
MKVTDERLYTVEDGIYKFTLSDSIELHFRSVNRDRHGRLYSDARFLTRDGKLIAQDVGEVTSGKWREKIAQQVIARTSGKILEVENDIMSALMTME